MSLDSQIRRCMKPSATYFLCQLAKVKGPIVAVMRDGTLLGLTSDGVLGQYDTASPPVFHPFEEDALIKASWEQVGALLDRCGEMGHPY